MATGVSKMNEQRLTDEELLLCLPYSETAQWERVLASQHFHGRSDFKGPPGLLEKMVAQQSFIAVLAQILEPST